MANYFIGDLHFGHKNCIAFDNRPFENIEEHNETLIKNWNNTITEDDTVYIIGDISWYSPTKTVEILKKLYGEKRIIVGNHDSRLLKNKNFRFEFEEITDYKELKLEDGKGIILCHYPIPCFKNYRHGWYHYYAHVHNSSEYELIQKTKKEIEKLSGEVCNMYNVGCMMPYMNYTPRTHEEILKNGK